MATKIVTKNSSTAGSAPSASDLVQGELAVNVVDKRLYTEDNAGNIVELGTNPLGEITANGGIALGDSDKATFGASDDLQIYHDGSNSYIKDAGTGNLNIQTNGVGVVISDTSASDLAVFNAGSGVVTLYKSGAPKLATTATGIDVTGTATMEAVALNTPLKTWDASTDAIQFQSGSLWNYSTSQLNLGQNEYYNGAYKYLTTGFATTYNQASGGHYFKTASSGSADATITWRNALNIANNGDISFYDDSGNAKFFWDASAESLGIGTSSPSSSSGYGTLSINGTTGGQLAFQTGGSAKQFIFSTSTDLSIYNQEAGNIKFVTNNAEAMLIDSSGNVGIGTNLPQAKMDVAGVSNFSTGYGTFTGDGLHIQCTGTGGANAYSGGISFSRISADNNSRAAGIAGVQGADADQLGLAFFTHPSATTTDALVEAMRIDSEGSMSFGGITTPTHQTDSLVIYQSDNYALYSGSNGTGGSNHMVFGNANGWVGSITTNGTATAYNTSSDYRLKEDDVPMTGATERVKALRPVNFAWKSDGSRVDGFLAHEAQEVVPECVTGTKDAMRDEEYEVTAAVYEDVTTPAVAAVEGVEAIEAVEAVDAVYDDEGVIVSEAIEAVEAVEGVEAVEAVAETTEAVLVTEAVMGTRSVPDMQGIDQSKIVPLLTAALQEAITKIESLEARLSALEE